ncbi:MAG: diacylglycerol kinase family lipid kinase [Bacteroidetes bacterium]|nr:diacylglycerol kinase family lipid kinase [Bacteroidota bacterium]
MDHEWFVIVNPNAGRRMGEKDWKKISRLLVDHDILFSSVFTEHRNHAIKLAKKYIEKGFKHIIVVGGDGTFNEVVNGVFLQQKYPPLDITLGLIPVGTGNDWGRMFNIPSKYEEAIHVIVEGNTFIQDVARVTYYNSDSHRSRYFVNVSGMGYDAIVAEKTNRQKDEGKGGPLSYLLNIFTSLFSYKHQDYEITVDGKPVKGEVFSMNVGICKYNGGGMIQLPFAVPDDGLLDLTVINNIGKFKVIRSVRKLYDGSLVNMPQVNTYQGKTITVKSSTPLYLEADGESLGHSPFLFEIVPLSLKVIIGTPHADHSSHH